MLSLTPSQLADVASRHPQVGEIWRRFKADIERPIAVILILNTSAHTIGASVAGAQFDQLFGDRWIWLFSILFTFAMLQYTEILPKTLGVYFNQTVAVWIARPLSGAMRILTPIINTLNVLNRPFERRRTQRQPPATLEEIVSLAAMARMARDIGAHQERIIRGAARLSDTPVRQVMIPVEQVAMLRESQPLDEAVVAAHHDAHTRFPICRENDRDHIVGYVNFKEMIYYMSTNPSDPTLRGITRPIIYVDPEEPASELLKLFIDQHEHIAIARDRDGRCVGLITLEDVIEELVGELQDEFDRLPHHIHALSGGVWMFGGGVTMNELAGRMGVPAVARGGTVAAWFEREFGRTPKPDMTLQCDQMEFVVRRVRRGRVFEASAVTQR